MQQSTSFETLKPVKTLFSLVLSYSLMLCIIQDITVIANISLEFICKMLYGLIRCMKLAEHIAPCDILRYGTLKIPISLIQLLEVILGYLSESKSLNNYK